MIKAVLFDALDTLFWPYPDRVAMYQRIIKEITGLDKTYEEVRVAWSAVVDETEAAAQKECDTTNTTGNAWEGFNGRVVERLGYKGDCTAAGKKIKYESWGNIDNYRLYPDVIDALSSLKEKGIRIGCVSNEDGYLESFFTKFDITDYFEIILSSEEVGCEKPAPGIFQIALTRMNLTAEEVIFVGDGLHSDYFGSQSVGMKPLLIDREDKVADDSIVKIKSLTQIGEYL
jgi:HAD superfamily hydrolase (TIGR01662 family)